MKYDLTSDSIFFRPIMRLNYINNCRAVFNFKQMGLFLIYQGTWGLGGLRDMIPWERSYWFSTYIGVIGYQFIMYELRTKITKLLLVSDLVWNPFLIWCIYEARHCNNMFTDVKHPQGNSPLKITNDGLILLGILII